MKDFLEEISALSLEQQVSLLSRRLQRSETARQEAERMLERRARELAQANKDLLGREEDLRDRLEFNNSQLLAAQRTAGIATVFRRRGGKTAYSPGFARLLGLPRSRTIDAAALANLAHPLDRMRIEEEERQFYSAQAPGKDHVYEYRIKRPDTGEIRWLRWTLRREVDEEGKLVSVSGTVQDFTEQRLSSRRVRALGLIAERRVRQLRQLSDDLEAARQAEQKVSAFLQAILDSVPQGIAVFDADLKLQVWNSPLAEIIEFDPQLLRVGMPLMVAPPLGSNTDASLSAAQAIPDRDASGKVIDKSYERELSDGRIIQVAIVGRDDGSMVRIYSDISRYKQVESALRVQQGELALRVVDLVRVSSELQEATGDKQKALDFLRAVLDTVPQGIAVFDEGRRLSAWNDPLAGLTEIAPDRLVEGLPFEKFVSMHWSHDPDASSDRLHRDDNGRVLPQEFEQQLSDGRTVQVGVIPRGAGGMIKTYTDVTQYKAIEADLRRKRDELGERVDDLTRMSEALHQSNAEAEQASRYKSQFLAMMSHDIRTPMNGVLGLLDTLSRTQLDDEQRNRLELARDSGRQLSVLLNDIIEIVRAESGKIDLQPEPLEIRRVAEGIVRFWEAANDNKDLQLLLECDERLPDRLLLDPTRFRQLIDNLVSNALKYTSRGQICVRLLAAGPMFRVEISDTGPGLSEAQQKRIFADFSRLRDLPSLSGQSSGLGLAICRRLVTAMGGEIGVDSEVGHGCTFWFQLPLVKISTGFPHVRLAAAEAGELPQLGARILIAEDVETNRIVLSAMLDQLGCTYDCVANGREAVDAATVGSFDCILMDVSMPEMDGIEATRAIRRLAGERSRVPIIGVTAHVLPDEHEELIACGMDELVTKPISMRRLLDALVTQLPQAAVEGNVELPILDTAALEELLAALPPARHHEIVAHSVLDIERLAEELAEALQRGEGERIRRAAHSLKGVAANIGAVRLASTLEAAASIDPPAVQRAAAQTLSELRRRFPDHAAEVTVQ